MVCIFCGSNTRVTNSRLQKRANHVWRRRHCLSCGNTFTTTEAAALDGSLNYTAQRAENNQNQAKQGRLRQPPKQPSRQPFVQEMLFVSLYDSLRHRSSALTDAAALLQTVLGRLLPLVEDGSLTRSDVVKVTSQVLKRFDRAAAVSYLAFHPL